jgi:hypothetical protein
MKTYMVLIALLSLAIIGTTLASDFQNVGKDFGRSWLQQNGTIFVKEDKTSLWNWGNLPKGYTYVNETLYPPGYGIEWYYPDFMISSTPIMINRTAINGNFYIPQDFISPPFINENPWLLAQLTGRPVATFSSPRGHLF